MNYKRRASTKRNKEAQLRPQTKSEYAHELPPALRSLWRAVQLAYGAEPRLFVASFALSLLSAVPEASLAIWVATFGAGLIKGYHTLLFVAAAGLALSVTCVWLVKVIGARVQNRFRDRVAIVLESRVAFLSASVATISHHERKDYVERLGMLRDQAFVLEHMFGSLFATCGWFLRLSLTIVLLTLVSPILILLAVFAIPTVIVSVLRPKIERKVQESVWQVARLARHLFDLMTTAAPGKELRVLGIQQKILQRWTGVRSNWYQPIAKSRWVTMFWHVLAWATFGTGYFGALLYVASRPHLPAFWLLLVLSAAAQLATYINGTVGELGFLRGFWLEGARRLAWLEDYHRWSFRDGTASPPERLKHGIRFENVSFTYPGTSRCVLDRITLDFEPGSVVAIVGENGAGKSTLVKLLCGFYEPTEGQILVDNIPLMSIDLAQWRLRLGGALQRFCRFEFLAYQSIGLGDLSRLEERSAVVAAVQRSGAGDVVEKLRSGLETQLGGSWPGGDELSFGQWQKVALARGFMRDAPLMLVLDEPTAALDAETEHALFMRYAAAARRTAENGQITVLISHRFSTVQMADKIVVLDGQRVAEQGTRAELMAMGGQYARLYNTQAAGYS